MENKMHLDAEKVMSLNVELGDAKVVGQTIEGLLTIIPIIGGTFEGPQLEGRVCAGGADWNTIVSETIAHVHAKYWIETDDHVVISVENEGYIDQLRRDAVIRTTPRFLCDLQSRYAFLAKDTFAGELVGGNNNSVDITIFKLS
jgi:hypothetical protein